MRQALRWVFLTGPCRFYLSLETGGTSMRFLWMARAIGLGAAGAVLGALGALLEHHRVSDWPATGFITGIVTFAAWALYSIALIIVLWFKGESPLQVIRAEAAGRDGPDAGDTPEAMA